MLTHLYISNFTLIDKLDIDFQSEFSVITGETGAGKSIILGAISLLMGQRAESRMLRRSDKKCVIEASFDISAYDLSRFFYNHDLDNDNKQCILRRELTPTAGSRAFINDTPVALSTLKELGSQLLDIHSQHQNLLLGTANFQMEVVDIIARSENTLLAFKACYASYQEMKAHCEEMEKALATTRERADFLRFQYSELTEAHLVAGEQEELEQQATMMSHTEEIKGALYKVDELLSNDDTGIVRQLRSTRDTLASLQQLLPATHDLVERIESCRIELGDVAGEIGRQLEDTDFDPSALDTVNNRLDTLYALERKYHCEHVEELIEQRQKIEHQLMGIDHGDEELEVLKAQINKQHEECVTLASQLHSQREAAIPTIEETMLTQLRDLGMPNVRFTVQLTEAPLGQLGMSSVSFLFSANSGSELLPVSQVASGGEVARVMLSLKAMISRTIHLPTVIFDEIDTGVSGKIAERMALIMQQMGQQGRQVISITHLPQIAALGTTHYKVEKTEDDGVTNSHMRILSYEQRVEEIAQMLSGSSITKAAVSNARALLRQSLIVVFMLFAWLTASAQPKWAGQTARSIVTVKTFNANNRLLGSTNAFIVGSGGEAVALLQPFLGASRAIAIDTKGKEWPVTAILGADNNYDVVKLKINIDKCQPLTLSKKTLGVGEPLWLQPYSTKKKGELITATAERVETVKDSLPYYTVSFPTDAKVTTESHLTANDGGAPLLDDEGKAVALFLTDGGASSHRGYGVSINLVNALHTNGLSINDATLRQIGIKKALPADQQQAELTLFLAGAAVDSTSIASYAQVIEDFIAAFPSSPEGFISRANLASAHQRYADADADMQQALERCQPSENTAAEKAKEQEAGVHYSYAQLISRQLVSDTLTHFTPWTFDKAIHEATSAYALHPLPLYLKFASRLYLFQHRYAEAYSSLVPLHERGDADAETYATMAECKELLGDSLAALSLLDSAVVTFSVPLLKDAAPYLLLRARAHMRCNNYRKAFNDYNSYASLMPANLSATFYYERAQACVGGRLYQQALNDYEQAIALQPSNAFFYAEKASLEIRVNLLPAAIATAKACIEAAPEHSDGYLFLGLAQCLSGMKSEGRIHLIKAKEMGDPQAEQLISKYAE